MFECVINLSEGRDLAVIERLARAAGTSLRDLHHDEFHNRSVYTLINAPNDLACDVRDLVNAAFATLDLSEHTGVHPRLGVVDVVPFVPLGSETLANAVRLRNATAQWISSAHQVPVFLYGPTASGERTLPFVRSHAFVDLAPDFGPAAPDARRGACVVGARPILVAWNLWLRGVPVERARLLAQLVRRPGVRALGLAVGDLVQVSCNLVDLSVVRPSQIYDAVAHNVPAGAIEHAELVGLAPRALLDAEDPARWSELGLSEDATIESRLAGGRTP